MNKSAVIFDLDGTLTKPFLDFDAIRREIGVSGPILEAMARLSEPQRLRADAILERHEWEAARNAELHDGAREIVAECRARGFPVAVMTRNARSTASYVLDAYGIVVDALRTREDGAIKPSPKPVLELCELLGADRRRSWVIGDYRFDIISGRAAGARTILMIGSGPPPAYAADANHVIRRLDEILPILDNGSR